MKNSLISRIIVTLCLAWVCGAASASPVTISFTQNGFRSFNGNAGGSIAGSFSGEDQNSDGYLSFGDGEVQSYSATFSGNVDIPAFSHGIQDLQFFSYAIGSPGFGYDIFFGLGFFNILYSSNGLSSYDADDAQVWLGSYGSGPNYHTDENALVTSVPEPNALALLFGGLLLLIPFKRANRNR